MLQTVNEKPAQRTRHKKNHTIYISKSKTKKKLYRTQLYEIPEKEKTVVLQYYIGKTNGKFVHGKNKTENFRYI